MWLIKKQSLNKAPFGFKKSLALSEAFFCPFPGVALRCAFPSGAVEVFVLGDEPFEIDRAQAA